MTASELPYVVVLAGGEGQRLAPLTRALYGTDRPKQFAVLSGERSLLQTTIERAARLTVLDRISVIVTAHHEALANRCSSRVSLSSGMVYLSRWLVIIGVRSA